MSAPQQTTETPAVKKPGRWKKGLLIGAFTLAVGGLIYDNLSLRVDNYFLGAAVVEQHVQMQELAEENVAAKLLLLGSAAAIGELMEENQMLKEHIMGGAEPEDDAAPVVPQQQNRIIQVSTKVPARPSI